MQKKRSFLFVTVALLIMALVFFSKAYRELTQYSELSGRAKTVYVSFQKLSRRVNHAAVLTPELETASQLLKVETLFYADSQSVMQELMLLKSTVKDSVNIAIALQLDSIISEELPWILKSNVPDSIIHGRSIPHVKMLQRIDSLINAGIERTDTIIGYRKNKVEEAVNQVSVWMIIFIGLGSALFLYTIITERKNAENILAKNEKRFRALVENYDAIIVVVDEKLSPFYRTPAAERLTGYSVADRNGKKGIDEVHPDDLEAVMNCMKEVKAHPGALYPLLFRIKHKQGHYIWLESLFTNLLGDPAVQGIVINMRDVSERKRIETEIINAYKEKETVLNRINDSVVSVDNNWRYTFLNEAALSTHPLGKQETLGKVIWEVHPEMEGTIFQAKYREAMETRTVVELENYYAPMNTWFLVKVYPASDGLTIFYTDITDRKRAELLLKEAAAQQSILAAIVNSSDDAIISKTLNGTITSWNRGAETIFGHSAEDAIGKPISMILPADLINEEPKIIRGISQGKHIEHFETERLKKDGSRISVSLTISPILDRNGTIIGASKIARDITEQRKAEDKLKASEWQYRSLIEQASDAIFIANQQGQYIEVNSSACQLLGYSKDELLRLSGKDILYTMEGIENLPERYDQLREGTSTILENRLKRKDGIPVDVEINSRMLSDGRFVGIVRDISERKKTELRLSKTLKEVTDYKFALNEACIVAITDQKGIIRDVNNNFCSISKFAREELIGKDHRITNSGYHSKEFIKDIWTTISKGNVWRNEIKNKAKDGSYYWVDTTIIPFLDEELRPYQYIAIRSDITERKIAEDKLLQERTLLRTLIDNLPDYIYVKDEQSRFLINNKANLDLIGVDREELTLGRTVMDFFAPAIAQSFTAGDNHVFLTGIPLTDQEETTVNRTGERKFLLTTKVPLKDQQNSIIGLVGISRDITKQKQVELALRNSNYFLESAQRVGKIGHWISAIGQAGKLTWSSETCRIFGLTPETFDGELETFFKLIHPEDVAEVNSAVDFSLANNSTFSIDHRIILADGTLKWVNEQGEPTVDSDGKPTSLVGIVQDITQRKETENEILKLNEELEERVKIRTEQLQVANKEMEAFTYSVSHDLRSPLRIIDGYSQILLEDYAGALDNEGRKTLDIIMSNAKKMGQLIDDLLNFSRIGRVEIRRTKVNMNRLVEEVIQELRLGRVEIPVNLRIAPLASANGDPNLIKHVLINLIANAIKYSSAKETPEIEVGMYDENNKTIYFIKDNGAGFDMTYYHKLFGVFQRLHSHDQFSGTGVGLAIVERIISRHGGSIWAKAKVNEGATFFFSVD